jgi:flavoprotein|tara:strand:- start:144 stop:338 length:195 start_codon:yes stop_codon:yes gene_type:complete
MIDKILEKFFGYMDIVCEGITNLVIEKPKRKKAKKCKKCHHKCHCKDEFHSDEYGLCACEGCKC